MVTTLNFNGVEFVITDTGVLESKDPVMSGAMAPNCVGIQVNQHPLVPQDSIEMKAQMFIEPAKARLMAQALLAAATSVQSRL